jgi:hypothetical protein
MAGRIEEDLYYAGAVKFKDITVNAGSIDDNAIDTNAGIAYTKLEHEHRVHYAQPNTTATSETKAVYRCRGATGTIIGVAAGSIAACVGDSTVTIDVKKNGTTVLASTIVLDSANSAYTAETGSLSVTSLAAGDVLTVVVTVSAGTGTLATGLYVSLSVAEDAT